MAKIPNPQSELLREPNLLIPGKKPVGSVKIDWSHPLAKGWSAFFCPLPHNKSDLVNGNQPEFWSGAGWQTCSEGIGWRKDTDGQLQQYPYVPGYSIDGDFTLMWRGYLYGEIAGLMGFMGQRSGGLSAGEWSWYSNGDASNDEVVFLHHTTSSSTVFSTLNTWPAVHPELYTLFVTQSNGGNSWKLYVKYGSSLYTETDTETSEMPFTTVQAPLILNDITIGATNGVDAIYLCGGICQRALSDNEVLSMIADPYQFLIPA